MATTVRRVEYFYVMAPDRPGEAARLLRHLAKAKVNLLAFSGFPAGRGAQIDFVPENPPAFRRVGRSPPPPRGPFSPAPRAPAGTTAGTTCAFSSPPGTGRPDPA